MESERYKNCLRQIRAKAADVKDEKTGVVVKKEEWQKLKVHVASKNNFPTAAGLASSAAGFACLGPVSISFFLGFAIGRIRSVASFSLCRRDWAENWKSHDRIPSCTRRRGCVLVWKK